VSNQQLLDQIASQIQNCKICKTNKTGSPVPGEGNADARIAFIGEAPGRTESQTGKPFVGRSGQYLTKLIESIGLNRKNVYITSPVKYFPIDKNGKGRAPTPAEIAHGKTHLAKQLTIINPKVIVLLGNTAARSLLPNPIQVSKSHGIPIESHPIFFPTYHPAAAIRFAKNRPIIETDFQKLKHLISPPR